MDSDPVAAFVARRQSSGRGRRGRGWVSEPGNLYASLLLIDPAPPPRAAELSLVAALAVHDSVAEVASGLGPRLKLKWPNDVVCDGAKLAGILVEGESAPDRALAVVIGIGVNCARHPTGTPYPTTDLAEAGALVTADALLQSLMPAMARRLAEWNRGVGFAAVRAAWLKRAAGLGEPARIRLPEREIEGRIETLDEAGRLMVRLADGRIEHVTKTQSAAKPNIVLASQRPFAALKLAMRLGVEVRIEGPAANALERHLCLDLAIWRLPGAE